MIQRNILTHHKFYSLLRSNTTQKGACAMQKAFTIAYKFFYIFVIYWSISLNRFNQNVNFLSQLSKLLVRVLVCFTKFGILNFQSFKSAHTQHPAWAWNIVSPETWLNRHAPIRLTNFFSNWFTVNNLNHFPDTYTFAKQSKSLVQVRETFQSHFAISCNLLN